MGPTHHIFSFLFISPRPPTVPRSHHRPWRTSSSSLPWRIGARWRRTARQAGAAGGSDIGGRAVPRPSSLLLHLPSLRLLRRRRLGSSARLGSGVPPAPSAAAEAAARARHMRRRARALACSPAGAAKLELTRARRRGWRSSSRLPGYLPLSFVLGDGLPPSLHPARQVPACAGRRRLGGGPVDAAAARAGWSARAPRQAATSAVQLLLYLARNREPQPVL